MSIDPSRPSSSSVTTSGIGSGAASHDPRIHGPTPITHIMHSMATFPAEHMGAYDWKHGFTWEVKEDGDGLIKVSDTIGIDETAANGADWEGEGKDLRGSTIAPDVASHLINFFFQHHSQHFPIVSKKEFLFSYQPDPSSSTPAPKPHPMLLQCICGISAQASTVPAHICDTIKNNIHQMFREEDVLDWGNLATVQSLLIYSFSLEFSQGRASGNKNWNVLSLAIRMAQSLGLHRETAAEKERQTMADHIEVRRRVWGGCLVADRWISACFGLPMVIDLADCDRLFPSVHDIVPGQEPHQVDRGSRPYLFNTVMIQLSIILGKIQRSLYSPTGILNLKDGEAEQLQAELGAWDRNIPPELQFNGPENSNPQAGSCSSLHCENFQRACRLPPSHVCHPNVSSPSTLLEVVLHLPR
ncbi:hypothetical protein BT69DRAFT_91777 [Atractiella rhizophila]|nr:hypothetical protein BT69DRAFT_91777 [Atractiella rhizophila]